MTTRIQVSVDIKLHARARRRAKQMGISLAEYIRRLVGEDLPPLRKGRFDISDLIGFGDSGGTDIARDKHRLIYESIAADKLK